MHWRRPKSATTAKETTLDTNYSRFNIEREAGASMPVSPPSDGVVTKWKVSSMPVASALPEMLKVIRPTGDTYKFGIVGESRVELVQSGSNVFDTRIPVKAGDDFGVRRLPRGRAVHYRGSAGPGLLHRRQPSGRHNSDLRQSRASSRPPSRRSIEPDVRRRRLRRRDAGSAARRAPSYQGACPVVPPVTLKTRSKVRKRAILVWAIPSGQATVDSYGQVGWGYTPSPKLKTAGAKPKAY